MRQLHINPSDIDVSISSLSQTGYKKDIRVSEEVQSAFDRSLDMLRRVLYWIEIPKFRSAQTEPRAEWWDTAQHGNVSPFSVELPYKMCWNHKWSKVRYEIHWHFSISVESLAPPWWPSFRISLAAKLKMTQFVSQAVTATGIQLSPS